MDNLLTVKNLQAARDLMLSKRVRNDKWIAYLLNHTNINIADEILYGYSKHSSL